MKSKIDFSKPNKGPQNAPFRGLVYGPEGVGKSSFLADAPSPYFWDVTGGTTQLNVDRVPLPENREVAWDDLLDLVRWMAEEQHGYQTLVLDELGALEAIAWEHVCRRDGMETIESYGYGKGYEIVMGEWRILLRYLEKLRARGINVGFLAHSQIKPFKNPEGEDFDRYVPLVHHKLSGLLKQWCDFVFFARFEELVDVDKSKRRRGQSTGLRLVHTVRTAAYDAKNRYNLPEVLELDWAAFAAARALGAPRSADDSLAELRAIGAAMGADFTAEIEAATKRANGDAVKLARLADWARNQQANNKGSER